MTQIATVEKDLGGGYAEVGGYLVLCPEDVVFYFSEVDVDVDCFEFHIFLLQTKTTLTLV